MGERGWMPPSPSLLPPTPGPPGRGGWLRPAGPRGGGPGQPGQS